MKVVLREHSGLALVEESARTCYNLEYKIDPDNVDIEYIKKVVHQYHHTSVGEKWHLTFRLIDFPRNVLQEISRHRIAVSPSVKSTRYTFGRLLEEGKRPFFEVRDIVKQNLYPSVFIDDLASEFASKVRRIVLMDKLSKKEKIEELKHALPESWLTTGLYQFNMVSLQHLFDLRLVPTVFTPFYLLANMMYDVIPEDLQCLFTRSDQ